MTEKEKINFWGEFMTTLHKNLHKYLKYKLKDIELKKEEVHFLHYISENDSVEQNTYHNALMWTKVQQLVE